MPNNMVKPDKCATAECGGGLQPLPTPNTSCEKTCMAKAAIACPTAAFGAAKATGIGFWPAEALDTACTLIYYTNCKANNCEKERCRNVY